MQRTELSSKTATSCVAVVLACCAATTTATAVTETMTGNDAHTNESTGRLELVTAAGTGRLTLSAPHRTLTITIAGAKSREVRTAALTAIIYDEASETVTVETEGATAPPSMQIGPIDGDGWTRLQLFVLDRPQLGAGPLARRSPGALQIAFPGEPESMIKIDAAGERLFIEPAGTKGFAPQASSVDSISFDAGAHLLKLQLRLRGAATTVELGPMTEPVWKLLRAFVAEHDQLRFVLVE